MLIITPFPCLVIDGDKDDDDDSWQFIRSAHICLPRCGQGGGGVCGSPPRHWWCAQGNPRKPEIRKMRRMMKMDEDEDGGGQGNANEHSRHLARLLQCRGL